jgi:hypothetical protein
LDFIILVGGPGTFNSHDKLHDKTWLNYFHPIRVAAEKNLYNRESGEQVHWVVYEPAYEVRWLDDSEITLAERWNEWTTKGRLNNERKRHADEVRKKGAASYIDLIRRLAQKNAITYKGIKRPSEFWDYVAGRPPRSISRVWYSGHASEAGLFLQLDHMRDGTARAADGSVLAKAEIEAQPQLKDRFATRSAGPSRFYGCHTAVFAKAWHDMFGVPTAGAARSITYKDILTIDPKKLLKTLEQTPTAQGTPDWTAY